MSSTCRDCGARVMWGMTVPRNPEATPSRIPIDAEMVPPGSKQALACVPDPDAGMLVIGRTVLLARLIAQHRWSEEQARQYAFATYPWRIAHLNTCPNRR